MHDGRLRRSTPDEQILVYGFPGKLVELEFSTRDGRQIAYMTPEMARDIAAGLRKAADEAEREA